MTTFTEETINPRKTIPRAILLVAILAGMIFILVAYTPVHVHPGGIFDDPDRAALDIAAMIGGNVFSAIFLAAVIIAQFTAGLAVQAAGARLMFAMGRDEHYPKDLCRRERPFPHPRDQHHRGRRDRTARNVPDHLDIDLVHQLRGVRRVHHGQRHRHRAVPARSFDQEAEPAFLDLPAADRPGGRDLADDPPRLARPGPRWPLAGGRASLAHLPHEGLPQAAPGVHIAEELPDELDSAPGSA